VYIYRSIIKGYLQTHLLWPSIAKYKWQTNVIILKMSKITYQDETKTQMTSCSTQSQYKNTCEELKALLHASSFCHYVEAPSSGRITSKEIYHIPTNEEVQCVPRPVLTLQTTGRDFALKDGFETTAEHYTN